MAFTLAEWLEPAPQRDSECQQRIAAAEVREDEYYDEISRLIDEHPVGRPIAKVS